MNTNTNLSHVNEDKMNGKKEPPLMSFPLVTPPKESLDYHCEHARGQGNNSLLVSLGATFRNAYCTPLRWCALLPLRYFYVGQEHASSRENRHTCSLPLRCFPMVLTIEGGSCGNEHPQTISISSCCFISSKNGAQRASSSLPLCSSCFV